MPHMAQLCQSSTFLFQHPLLLHINYRHGHTSSSLPHPFVRQVECLRSAMSFTLWPRREEDTMPPAETKRTHQDTAPRHTGQGEGGRETLTELPALHRPRVWLRQVTGFLHVFCRVQDTMGFSTDGWNNNDKITNFNYYLFSYARP